MSEYILCRGNKPSENNEKIQICEIDDFLREKASAIWGNDNSVWTLMFNCHELKRCVSKEQVLDVCYKGITDEYHTVKW